MWRPAICVSASSRSRPAAGVAARRRPRPLENHGGTARAVAGAYACSIEESGYRYPAFHCVISEAGGRLELVKLDGSQRFEGEVREARGRLEFSGRFYCPFGDCTQDLHGVFAPDGAGGLKGTFTDAKFVVWMVPASGAYGRLGTAGRRMVARTMAGLAMAAPATRNWTTDLASGR